MIKHINRICSIAIPVVLFAAMLFSGVLYHADMLISDRLYQQLETPDRNIILITVDERAELEYGKFSGWSREKLADLAEYLYSDPEYRPAVLGFDFMLIGEENPEADARLAAVCEQAGNVVCASNLKYEGVLKTDENGKSYFDDNHISHVELPYDELNEVVTSGFANACISRDNIIRSAQLYATHEGRQLDSLAYAVYRNYAASQGIEAVKPSTNSLGQVGFFYSGLPMDTANVSIVDVLDGKIPLSEFNNSIVLVGAYAAGFQDAYQTSVSSGEQMYGVEINANIIRALMMDKLYYPAPTWLYTLIAAAVLVAFIVIAEKQKLFFIFMEGAALSVVHMIVGRILACCGITIPQIYFIATVAVIFILFVIQKYIVESMKRQHALKTLKKYVAPQIVDKLSRSGSFELHLGGEKRNIAVLFVDIRGFTTMSESLPPETVVEILNRYLSVTTECVFRNEGTLDKFIGDATMAVFNAPFELEEPVLKAVKTAWDIQQGVAEISGRIYEKYGKQFKVGIGINYGDAIVGNIGCDFRMDYTAIGDTVNTAARLESNAKAGQILISQAAYDVIKDRITAQSIGEIPLKGKLNRIAVYEVTGFTEGEIQHEKQTEMADNP